MDDKGTIRAVQSALDSIGPLGSEDRAEGFAQQRFFAKFERPDRSKSEQRSTECWNEWIDSDHQLGSTYQGGLLGPQWALTRLIIAEILADFRLGGTSFTTGSEFVATRGFNSIEHKLRQSEWTCTPDNLGLWYDTVYQHHGLKTAAKKRFSKLLASKQLNDKAVDRQLWTKFRKEPNPGKAIMAFKTFAVTEVVSGNRFSTVPKNNLKDRPICIEPLANILTQRRIGIGIRDCLKRFGVDLDHTAEKHRMMIANKKFATLDLKNASDRILLSLVRYLLPSRVYRLIDMTRSEMTLGPDGLYYYIRKVSSMGNGFTFELMSLILYALCQTYDKSSSVFGDDIIISSQHANSLVEDLERAGFIVNMSKTHIDDGYRESCGSHFLDGYGYIESYDCRWPETMMDVVTTLNKLSRLATLYPSFVPIFVRVYEATPRSLYPENPFKSEGMWRRSTQDSFGSYKLDDHVVMSPFQTRLDDGMKWKRHAWKTFESFCQDLQINPKGASLHMGYEWVDAATSPRSLDSQRHWAKYLMYLASGRSVPATVRGKGAVKSFMVVTLKNGDSIRWSAVVTHAKR